MTSIVTTVEDVPGAAAAPNEFGRLLDTYGNDFTVPNITIKQIRDAIPAHYFDRSARRGYSYVLRDILLLATTFYVFNHYNTPGLIPSVMLRFGLWAIYGILQGLFATGLWVIAHECGHQSFSTSKIVNDTTGWFLHSALSVPYFSWKISHGKHHKATGHMERDMVFLPKTREVYASRVRRQVHEVFKLTDGAPLVTALVLIGRQLIGWPLYLLQNNTGHNYHEKQTEGRGLGKHNGFRGGVNHFNPSSPLYDAKDAKYDALSDLGLGITATVFYEVAQFTLFLVAITFLQHIDPTIPYYGSETWTFARGAATTVDRESGFIGLSPFHGIIENHVLHHFVSTISFYHADEATDATKPVLGQHYRSQTEGGAIGFMKGLWRNPRWCQWVERSERAEGLSKDIVFYGNRNWLGLSLFR